MENIRPRVIPVLLLKDESLVKTIKFKQYNYIGDPINTVRIFNELEVDELVILDISASRENRGPNFKLLESIAVECFMPLAYGGGIRSFEDAKKIFNMGFEKIVLNTILFENPKVIQQIVEVYGSQALVASVDYKVNFLGRKHVFSHGGTSREAVSLSSWVRELQNLGVGELLLNCMDRDGTWMGYDLNVISELSSDISIPLVAVGGAGSVEHLGDAVKHGASAVGVGSMVVYQKKDMGVLINFPNKNDLKAVFR